MAGSCGIPLATQDRNSDFHALFRSVPENDPLLEDYKCALQKDILLQGHLYITENHICFNANIFGWVTNLVIAFSDITKVEKRMTAMIIPNAIHIYTANGKHVFASFLSRDLAYDQIFQLWQTHKHGQMLQPYIFDFVAKDGDSSSDNNDPESTDSSSFDQPFNLSDARQLFPQCPCCEQNEHYDNLLLQESLPGTVDNAFKLLFDSDFVEQYLSKVERLEDVGMGTWYHGSRKNIITTKDTNANSNDNKKSQGDTTNIVIEFKDEQIYCKSPYYMSIITSLQIPDGHRDSLTIKLRTCITRYNSTKVNVLVTFQFGDSKESEQKDHNQYNIKSRMLKDGAGRLSRVLRTKWIQQREEDYVKKRTEDKDKRPSVWNDRILREANLMPLSRVGRLKIRLVEGMKSGGAEMAMSWERLVCLLMNIVSFGLSVRLKERQFVFVLLCFVAAAVVVTNAILVHRLVTPTVATGPSFGLQGALGGDPWGLDQLRSEVIVLQEKISRLKADCERNGLLIPRQ
ncbi:GRAM domain-containing protein [Phycomyces blakesleeanus]